MTPIDVFVIVFVADHFLLAGIGAYLYFKKYKPLKNKIDSFMNEIDSLINKVSVDANEILADYRSAKKSLKGLKKTFDPLISLFIEEDKDE